MLLGERPISPLYFTGVPAITTQTVCSNLSFCQLDFDDGLPPFNYRFVTHFTACMVSQIAPVDFELALVVHVHEFMDQGVVEMFFVQETVRTKDYDACVVTESSSLVILARYA